jgi:serine/threonine protein phosphatase PrpC
MGIWDRLLRRTLGKREHDSPRDRSAGERLQRVNPLDIGQGTDIGRKREANEDAFLTLRSLISADAAPLPLALILVADGMGGHVKGREASSIAVRIAAGVVVRQILLPMLSSQATDMGSHPVHEVLTEATLSANEAVSKIEGDAGTTLTAVLIAGHSAYVSHIGDSRVYYLGDGELLQLTQDHSLVTRLVQLGQISPEEAQHHPQRNFLYRAVGQGPELEVDTHFQRLAQGSHLLICSDGLWNEVSDQQILEVTRRSSSPQEACNRLIDLANESGGADNITLVLASINY